MVIREALGLANEMLRKSGINSTVDAKVLFCHVTKKSELELIIGSRDEISSSVERKFFDLVKRRCDNEPLSYIVGQREFMSLNFKVQKGVLIPRPETELIVEYMIDNYKDKAVDCLDLCTGSGAIGVSVAYYIKNSCVTCVDISPVAIKCATENSQLMGVSDRVSVVSGDVLKGVDFGKKYDVVLSNPPYIPNDDVLYLEKNVKDFEPHLALCGGDDGLSFYRAIERCAQGILKKDGLILLEIGHNQYDSVKKILCEKFYDIKYIKDLAGIKRVVCANLK